jgi:hypothetical protein
LVEESGTNYMENALTMTNSRPSLDNFLSCRSHYASFSVPIDLKLNIRSIATPEPCFTKEGGRVILCRSCLGFWQECLLTDDHTAWAFAIVQRDFTPGAASLSAPQERVRV